MRVGQTVALIDAGAPLRLTIREPDVRRTSREQVRTLGLRSPPN